MCGHTYSKSMDQPGKVANPARHHHYNVSLSAFVPENLVSRDGFGNPVPRTSTSVLYSTGTGKRTTTTVL